MFALFVCTTAAVTCGSNGTGSPSQPSPNTPAPATPRLTAPAPEGPAESAQLDTLRPTLTVRNGTSDQPGTRTYEFQVSDTDTFASTAPASRYFSVVVNRTGVAEGTNGSTSFTPDQDLQPTTRFYWRARLVQGTTVSAWSEARRFNSKLVGYNRPGELYDPLIHGESVGTTIGSTTYVPGKGIRINDQNSYVRYQLPQTVAAGEFSVEVEGLAPNGPGEKMRVLSMMDGTGNLYVSKFLLNAQYRGRNGNPDNAISFKALFGDEDYKLEPDFAQRSAAIMSLDPSRTYLWRVSWNSEFRLVIQEGGNTIYNLGVSSPGGAYNPAPHYAYLGANNGPFGQEAGSFPGATYRNVWLSTRPRPASLGSALDKQ